MEHNEYSKELEMVNEKTKLEIESEKVKQQTIKEQIRLEKAKSRKETSIKRHIAKTIAAICFMLTGTVCITFITALFLPDKVEKALNIINNLI